MKRTIVDIHILQTVPPSNINRDDTGSPKTALYGGVRRSRVSSQAWKRATRLYFEKSLDVSDLGVRTRRVVELLADEIEQQAPKLADRARELAVATFTAVGVTVEVPPKRTGQRKGESEPELGVDDAGQPEEPRDEAASAEEPGQGDQRDGVEQSKYLVFLSWRQIQALARAAIDAADASNLEKALKAAKVKELADRDHAIEISLFGRMVADQTDLNVDAAAQVAHAISVHAVKPEFDYYTAVDDRNADDESGAGMIGTVEFNSSTLYRYAAVDVDRLVENLGDAAATKRAVETFAEAFVRSMPSGKRNSFANRTLPEAVVVMVRDTEPINLAGAFETPIAELYAEGRVKRACEALRDEAREIEGSYSEVPVAAWVTRVGEDTSSLDDLGTKVPLRDLVSSLGDLVGARLGAPA